MTATARAPSKYQHEEGESFREVEEPTSFPWVFCIETVTVYELQGASAGGKGIERRLESSQGGIRSRNSIGWDEKRNVKVRRGIRPSSGVVVGERRVGHCGVVCAVTHDSQDVSVESRLSVL